MGKLRKQILRYIYYINSLLWKFKHCMKPVRNLRFVNVGLGWSSFSRQNGWKLQNKTVNFQINFTLSSIQCLQIFIFDSICRNIKHYAKLLKNKQTLVHNSNSISAHMLALKKWRKFRKDYFSSRHRSWRIIDELFWMRSYVSRNWENCLHFVYAPRCVSFFLRTQVN